MNQKLLKKFKETEKEKKQADEWNIFTLATPTDILVREVINRINEEIEEHPGKDHKQDYADSVLIEIIHQLEEAKPILEKYLLITKVRRLRK